MLKTKTTAQADKFIDKVVDLYDNDKVRVNNVKNMNEIKGIIFGKELTHLTEEELKRALEPYKVSNIRQLTRRLNDKTIPIGAYVLTFDRNELPKDIKIVNFIYHPRPYYSGPFQCGRCLGYGHIIKTCTSERKLCRSCGSEELDNHKCPESCCPNCPDGSNSHCPTNSNCPEFLFEKVVQKLRTQKKISYRHAKTELLKKCQENFKSRNQTFSNQVLKYNEDTMDLEGRIESQRAQNKRAEQLNETLRKLVAENEEILKERRQLLETLRKQREQQLEIEKEIQYLGGTPIPLTEFQEQEDLEMDHEEFEDTTQDESLVQKPNKKMKTRSSEMSEEFILLSYQELLGILQKQEHLRNTVRHVETQNKGRKIEWFLRNGSLEHRII